MKRQKNKKQFAPIENGAKVRIKRPAILYGSDGVYFDTPIEMYPVGTEAIVDHRCQHLTDAYILTFPCGFQWQFHAASIEVIES